MKKKAKIYDCLKKFQFLWNEKLKSLRNIQRKRNETKIIKVFINWEKIWYISLDKLNRNLHIETKNKTDKVILFTDY